jgi:hypothetical protein
LFPAPFVCPLHPPLAAVEKDIWWDTNKKPRHEHGKKGAPTKKTMTSLVAVCLATFLLVGTCVLILFFAAAWHWWHDSHGPGEMVFALQPQYGILPTQQAENDRWEIQTRSGSLDYGTLHSWEAGGSSRGEDEHELRLEPGTSPTGISVLQSAASPPVTAVFDKDNDAPRVKFTPGGAAPGDILLADSNLRAPFDGECAFCEVAHYDESGGAVYVLVRKTSGEEQYVAKFLLRHGGGWQLADQLTPLPHAAAPRLFALQTAGEHVLVVQAAHVVEDGDGGVIWLFRRQEGADDAALATTIVVEHLHGLPSITADGSLLAVVTPTHVWVYLLDCDSSQVVCVGDEHCRAGSVPSNPNLLRAGLAGSESGGNYHLYMTDAQQRVILHRAQFLCDIEDPVQALQEANQTGATWSQLAATAPPPSIGGSGCRRRRRRCCRRQRCRCRQDGSITLTCPDVPTIQL